MPTWIHALARLAPLVVLVGSFDAGVAAAARGAIGGTTLGAQEPVEVGEVPQLPLRASVARHVPHPRPGAYVADGTARDLAGVSRGWRSGAGERGTVIALTSVTCPLSRRFGPELARLEDAFAPRGVGFVHLNVSGLDDAAAMAAQVADLGLDGPYLVDAERRLAQALGARTTTEVLVLDAAHTLVYRGAISDRYGLRHALPEAREPYLERALEALLAGERPAVRTTDAPGCVLELPAPPPHDAPEVTWSRDVSRLLQEHCVTCHRSGGVGPFPLERFEDAAPRAAMLAAVVEEGLMPPWFAAEVPPETHAGFANDRGLDAHERGLLARWLAAGKPRGDVAEDPLSLPPPDSRWALGEPDARFPIPRAIPVPADGVLDYVHLTVPTGFTEDRWVRALQVLPGERSVVHHVLVFVLPEEAFHRGRLRDPELLDETDGFFAAYVPGNDLQVFPADHGKLVPAGSVLLFQLHYTPNGRAVEDRTELGMWFHEEAPAHRVRTAGIANRRIRIPAGAPHHEERAAVELPADAHLLALLPHMHVRGSALRYELLPGTPDGPGNALLDVPRYDFNWQLRYELAEPMALPAGSVLRFHGWFDNSAGNPANPDPAREVDWGPQTTDEMLLGYVEYVLDEEDPEAPDRLPRLLVGVALDELQERVDGNGDGICERDECPTALRGAFDRLDRDADGVLTRLELARAASLRRR